MTSLCVFVGTAYGSSLPNVTPGHILYIALPQGGRRLLKDTPRHGHKTSGNIPTLSPLKIFSKSPEVTCASSEWHTVGVERPFPTLDLVLAVPLCPFCVWIQVVLANIILLGVWLQPEGSKAASIMPPQDLGGLQGGKPMGSYMVQYSMSQPKGLRTLCGHFFLVKRILADPQSTDRCKALRP